MMGPNNSGRRAASIMIAQPAWQFPITQGLPLASGCSSDDLFDEDRLGASNIFDRLTRHGLRQKSNEVARMAGFKCNADFAVGLESANSRTVTGARIDDDKGPQLRIDVDAVGRDNPHKSVIYRPLKLTAIDNQFHLVIEHMRRVFAICSRYWFPR